MFEQIRTALRLKSEEGATAVEYGIMVAAIAAVIITIVITLGNQVESGFNDVSNEMSSIAPSEDAGS